MTASFAGRLVMCASIFDRHRISCMRDIGVMSTSIRHLIGRQQHDKPDDGQHHEDRGEDVFFLVILLAHSFKIASCGHDFSCPLIRLPDALRVSGSRTRAQSYEPCNPAEAGCREGGSLSLPAPRFRGADFNWRTAEPEQGRRCFNLPEVYT